MSHRSSSNKKPTDAQSIEIKLTNNIETTRELTSHLLKIISDLEKKIDFQEIERIALEGDLKKEREKGQRFDKRNHELTKENGKMKSQLKRLEENVEALNDEVHMKDAQLKVLEEETEQLQNEKRSFNDRLKIFLQDVNVTFSKGELDKTEKAEESVNMENKKRTTDRDSIKIENATKRRKTVNLSDKSIVRSNELVQEPTVENQSDVLIGKTNVKPKLIGFIPDPAQSDVPDAMDNNELIPIAENSIKENFRRHIKAIINFEKLSPESKEALQREKQRMDQYQLRLQQYKEAFGALPGERSKFVLDFDVETTRQLLTVDKKFTLKLLPHQFEGIKFMWDNCFQSIKNLQSTGGSGCILSHCMGLGKTLQVVVLIHTLLRHFVKTKVEKVLIVCPSNTIHHWVDEFAFWLKDIASNNVHVFETSSCAVGERIKRMKSWHKHGGVFIVGYGMFQEMSENLPKNKSSENVIFHNASIDPGADLVVCDHGHLLKQPTSQLSLAISKVRTLRRIILTGVPLQTNFEEYFAMIEFVKPGLLGNVQEFYDRFADPILNGQLSRTSEEITVTKLRACILHKLLDGCVQRRNFTVLNEYLPTKQECVLLIRLTSVQIDLYKYYITNCVHGNPALDLPSLRRVCNHPNVLVDFAQRRTRDKAKAQKIIVESSNKHPDSNEPLSSDNEIDENMDENSEWWQPIFSGDKLDLQTGKMLIFFEILTECENRGEKLVVFSGCLSTLNVIEHYLILAATQQRNTKRMWTREEDYLRSDGTGNIAKRDIATFNDEANKRTRLILAIKSSGGIGIDLSAASRVLLFDLALNPSHDIQSILRTYRIGRKKECFVYRLIGLGTMEEHIYGQQVSTNRVIGRHRTEEELQQLYCVKNLDRPAKRQPHSPTEDDLLNSVLQKHQNTIYECRVDDSLFKNVYDLPLAEEDIGDVFKYFD